MMVRQHCHHVETLNTEMRNVHLKHAGYDAKFVGIDRELEEIKNIASRTPPMQGANDAWASWTPSYAQPSGNPGGHGAPGDRGGAGGG